MFLLFSVYILIWDKYILALILLTILMAWLEPTFSERIYIATLSIPCHIMYLLNSTWELPETADTVPYLSKLSRTNITRKNKINIHFFYISYTFTKFSISCNCYISRNSSCSMAS